MDKMTLNLFGRSARQSRHARYFVLILTAVVLASMGALSLCAAPNDTNAQSRTMRDGAHDFDFNVGVWHTHIRRHLDPFSALSETIELDGTVTVRKVWGGKAELEEIETDGSKGHWEGLSFFLYNPQSHQWSQSFINSQIGELSALTGEFHDGRIELFSGDTFKGKSILVRGVWSEIQPDSHRYTESYSDDGGQSWKESFNAELTRDKQAAQQDGSIIADPPAVAEDADQRGFDFDLGTWKTHSRRLLHPLTGSQDRVEMDGTTVVRKVWEGRANLAEYDANGTAGHITLMALRWFKPATHEWNIDFATPQVGMLGSVPGVGTYRNGRIDFYDYEMIGGRSVLVHFSIWKITDDSAQSEQAFSEDGGKTWEVNWINQYTRLKQD